MSRFIRNKQLSVGQVPGAAIFVGEKKVDAIEIALIDYDGKGLEQKTLDSVEDISAYHSKDSVTWINVYGLHDVEIVKKIASMFNIHPLTTEDILDTDQRPKLIVYDDYLHFTIKMLKFQKDEKEISSEQLSIILGEKFIITFQERRGDVFRNVRERIVKKKGRIRNSGVDYLAYSLIDTLIDEYMLIASDLGECIEDLESKILNDKKNEVLTDIYSYKKEINFIRKTVRPVRDFVLKMTHMESDFITSDSKLFFKDLLELTSHTMEVIDGYSEILSDNLDFYNSAANNKLNEIMKVLTIFSVIFIPLTFVAGIYGTNFEYIPELKYKYSYFIFWGLMIFIAGTMLLVFRKKKWI
jgi:magnesium transporter